MSENVRVGVGVIITKENTVLLGMRHGSHAAGVWALPGGHIEFGEEFVDCVGREVQEETGLICTDVHPLGFTNNVLPKDQKHYVTLYFAAQALGDPKIMEPEKCLEWRFFPLDDLPQNIWPGLDKTLEKLL